VNIASRADSGQWQFASTKILLSTDHAWNKEGVAGSQKWLPYHHPRGIWGVNGVQRQRQNKSNRTLGNSPKRWRRAQALIPRIPLNSKCNSLYLSLNTFSSRPFLCFILITYCTHFFLSFLAVQRSIVWISPFLFTNLIIYIEIWHIGKKEKKKGGFGLHLCHRGAVCSGFGMANIKNALIKVHKPAINMPTNHKKAKWEFGSSCQTQEWAHLNQVF
jgi:hypothetical protein